MTKTPRTEKTKTPAPQTGNSGGAEKARISGTEIVAKTPFTNDKTRFAVSAFSRKNLMIPYALFLLLFVIVPLLLIFYYAFTDKATDSFSVKNFVSFFTNATSITNLFLSFFIGCVTTALCLLIAYPAAYILSKMKAKSTYVILMLFIMPMWINFLLRALAMKELLTLFGIFAKNDFFNYFNTVIGMVYDFLPFMILPLYTVLVKTDKSYAEAAADLGANRAQVFFKVTLPLSKGGIVSGITMVLLPVMSCYVISDTFGNRKVNIIGKLIETQFNEASNWQYGSAIALIMLAVMFVTMLVTGAFREEKDERGNAL